MSLLFKAVRRSWILVSLLVLSAALLAACGDSSEDDATTGSSQPPRRTLYLSGIPDQNVSVLETRFNKLAQYLSEQTGLDVKYLASVDYAAVVTGFKNNDIQMGWYGGLTGVQARLALPGSIAIVQRESDEAFKSVFVARKGSGVTKLADIKAKSFAFGSESSTSGHLMPRYFLKEAGLTPEKDFASVTYTGSHDKTWKLVETGATDVGALNASVWEQRLKANEVDLTQVEVFYTTPPYYDYHFVIRPDIDKNYGAGAPQKLTAALLAIDPAKGGVHKEIFDAFEQSKFIPTKNDNYKAIEAVARELKLVE